MLHADGHAKWYPFTRLYPNGTENWVGDETRKDWNFWGFAWGDNTVGGRLDKDPISLR